MTPKDILQLESSDMRQAYLFEENGRWYAYEHSANRIEKFVKGFVDFKHKVQDVCGECNLNSVWFLFLLNHNKYNFFFLDLQMLLKVVFGCVQGRRRMSRLYTLAHIRELPFLCV